MSWDPIWEKIYSERSWGKYPDTDVVRFVARNFYNVENRGEVKLLEMGCGPGAQLCFMAREGFHVTGVEGSKTAVRIANERLDAEVPSWQGEVVEGDVISLAYGDEYFDAVLDIGVTPTTSFEVAQKIFSEASRVLKVGGLLYSRCLAKGCWGDNTGEEVAKNTYLVSEGPMVNQGAIRFTDKSEIQSLLPIDLELISIEVMSYGMEDKPVKQWMITAKKLGS
ncbi:class I SAM-dependent methyltransferase [Pseudoalteromonas piscicida]|uniref:class I SAM-dependent methyltransferase n=1 Tax=Pseudoalteromonas TaxID=53246 RepID=UPI001574DD1D|nr:MULTISPECIES: class I SAM-dependent methyltransferase [Pseudoalteromonas]MCG7552485.1 class I SAM-dependent methyltransferase [Pseudoalteromonas sp. Of11M-6]NSY32140.1 class I SAM-dependent methyltransferase [Pseudoalteromonas sp. JC28]UDM62203.1 class I SAM-dependent methyltransferase [Pseudoalteromonas piscicida]